MYKYIVGFGYESNEYTVSITVLSGMLNCLKPHFTSTTEQTQEKAYRWNISRNRCLHNKKEQGTKLARYITNESK